MGRVHSIHIAKGGSEPPVAVDEVKAVPGQGLEGDRYFKGTGTYKPDPKGERQVTLIEKEAIDAIAAESNIQIGMGDSRRNIVTEGVPLNHLVGREFQVGEVRFRGLRLCEPCNHLESLTVPGIRAALVHRGGLRAEILTEGIVRVGDAVKHQA